MKRWLTALLCALMLLGLSAVAEGGEITVPELENPFVRQIPDNDAMAFLRQMGVGWNLGNTFDAVRDNGGGNEMEIEKYWCGVYTTEAMFDALRDAGFSTVRVPVSWHNHVDADFTISTPWLDRVQEVVDWAIARDMTVILNTHHDVYEAFYYPSEACYEGSEKYIRTIWTQLADRFVDYGEKLIFESMNEPRQKDTKWEWWLDESNPACVEAAGCINRLNQAFVDTVRASGGNNATRYLMLPGYAASPQGALSALYTLPEDAADNKLIVSVHAYTPYAFALQDGGDRTFNIKGGLQASEISQFMNALYDRFIANGIPVVIGEFGARDKNGNGQARVDYAAYYAFSAKARGIPCCWWDNNIFAGSGERFGILNRADCTWPVPGIPEALARYGGAR